MGKAVENDDEYLIVGVVALELDGEPGWTGDGDDLFCPREGPREEAKKTSFFDPFGASSQLFNFSGFLGFGDLAAERKLRKRFISAGFASGGVLGCLVFYQKLAFKKLRKTFSVEKNGAKLSSSSHVSDHGWRTVSGGGFSCGAERVVGSL